MTKKKTKLTELLKRIDEAVKAVEEWADENQTEASYNFAGRFSADYIPIKPKERLTRMQAIEELASVNDLSEERIQQLRSVLSNTFSNDDTFEVNPWVNSDDDNYTREGWVTSSDYC